MRRNVTLDEVQERIDAYEAQYAWSTDEFLTFWRNGEVYETPDFRDWAMLASVLAVRRTK